MASLPPTPTTPTLSDGQRKALVLALKVAGAVSPIAFAYAVGIVTGHPIPLDLGAIVQAVAGAVGM